MRQWMEAPVSPTSLSRLGRERSQHAGAGGTLMQKTDDQNRCLKEEKLREPLISLIREPCHFLTVPRGGEGWKPEGPHHSSQRRFNAGAPGRGFGAVAMLTRPGWHQPCESWTLSSLPRGRDQRLGNAVRSSRRPLSLPTCQFANLSCLSSVLWPHSCDLPGVDAESYTASHPFFTLRPLLLAR